MRFVESVKSIASASTFVLRPARRAEGAGARLEDDEIAPEIAFLAAYGVPHAQLTAASHLAQKQNVAADQALLANGSVEARYFYQCLAHRLGLPFIEEPVRLMDVGALYPQTVRGGLIPYESPDGLAWLGAPRGKSILTLLRLSCDANALPRLAITTPSNLSQWIRESAHRRIAADASFELLSSNANLSAHDGLTLWQKMIASGVLCVFALSFLFPAAAPVRQTLVGLMFLAAIFFRLGVSAKAIGAPRPRRTQLEDRQLPAYTVLVALYREARIVKQLIRRLDRLDYPPAKLDIKIIIEEDDHETRRALEALPLAPVYEIIIAPDGHPRTKPRALNAALPFARGELIVVFDAEDEPDPQQLRRAAEEFAAAPAKIACLQAKLSIDNISDSWLTHGIMAQTPQAIPRAITI